AVPVQRYAFHGEWNYVIHPGPIPETVRNQTITLEPTNLFIVGPLTRPRSSPFHRPAAVGMKPESLKFVLISQSNGFR
ncbi:hypothetical protein, partial [Actinoplanes sp. NPDC026623]|uniref:hypothetical protein n=1 Tax=Actinoplanes sp. NPDC026623 TaxID=3155610 RepID=UPI0033E20BAA